VIAADGAQAPCARCPWLVEHELLTPEVQAAGLAGEWFCCHVRMGTCTGVAVWRRRKLKVAGGAEAEGGRV